MFRQGSHTNGWLDAQFSVCHFWWGTGRCFKWCSTGHLLNALQTLQDRCGLHSMDICCLDRTNALCGQEEEILHHSSHVRLIRRHSVSRKFVRTRIHSVDNITLVIDHSWSWTSPLSYLITRPLFMAFPLCGTLWKQRYYIIQALGVNWWHRACMKSLIPKARSLHNRHRAVQHQNLFRKVNQE